MSIERLWIRLGDNAEYEDFGQDFESLADILFEIITSCGEETDIKVISAKYNSLKRCNKYGISMIGFENLNYISLFWGDEDAQVLRALTDAELNRLYRFIAERLMNTYNFIVKT